MVSGFECRMPATQAAAGPAGDRGAARRGRGSPPAAPARGPRCVWRRRGRRAPRPRPSGRGGRTRRRPPRARGRATRSRPPRSRTPSATAPARAPRGGRPRRPGARARARRVGGCRTAPARRRPARAGPRRAPPAGRLGEQAQTERVEREECRPRRGPVGGEFGRVAVVRDHQVPRRVPARRRGDQQVAEPAGAAGDVWRVERVVHPGQAEGEHGADTATQTVNRETHSASQVSRTAWRWAAVRPGLVGAPAGAADPEIASVGVSELWIWRCPGSSRRGLRGASPRTTAVRPGCAVQEITPAGDNLAVASPRPPPRDDLRPRPPAVALCAPRD